MALKPGPRTEILDDISNFMCSAGEMGGMTSYVVQTVAVGLGMDDPSREVEYAAAVTGVPAGLLLNNVSVVDPCKFPPNCQDTCTVPTGSKVAVVKKGVLPTNMLAADVLAAGATNVVNQPAHLGASGTFTLVTTGDRVGTFKSDVDGDGFALVHVDVA